MGCRRAMLALLPPAMGALSAVRHFSQVAAEYAPLRKHPSLFEPSDVAGWLDERFCGLLQSIEQGKDAPYVIKEVSSEVYTFPLLTQHACRSLVEEIANFGASGIKARRPNNMNNYGVVLNDIGFRSSLNELQALVQPVARALFPVEGESLDDHHSFVVSYRPDQDKGLDMHTDDSDVTLNVCLGEDFQAAGLTFCGNVGAADHRIVSATYQHTPGHAVLHLGRRRHGADDIQSGHRINLIMWSYNRDYRASRAYRRRSQMFTRESSPPSPECTSYTHDRDFMQIRGDMDPEVRERAEKHSSKTWCPPPPCEYDGFDGVSGRYKAVDPFYRDLMN